MSNMPLMFVLFSFKCFNKEEGCNLRGKKRWRIKWGRVFLHKSLCPNWTFSANEPHALDPDHIFELTFTADCITSHGTSQPTHQWIQNHHIFCKRNRIFGKTQVSIKIAQYWFFFCRFSPLRRGPGRAPTSPGLLDDYEFRIFVKL